MAVVRSLCHDLLNLLLAQLGVRPGCVRPDPLGSCSSSSAWRWPSPIGQWISR